MAAAGRHFPHDERGYRRCVRQARRGNERVVGGIENQHRQRHVAQPRCGRRALPVVERAGEPVHRCGEGVIEGKQAAAGRDARRIGQARKLPHLGQRLGPQRAQEVVGVHPVEALAQRMAAGGQVEGRADGGAGAQRPRRRHRLFARPFGQRIAAQRNAHGEARHLRPALRHLLQHPIDLGAVARVIGARQAIGLAAATAKMHDQALPAVAPASVHHEARVMRTRIALESVEQHQHRRAGRDRRGGEVDVDEIAVRRVPALAPVRHLRHRQHARRHDGLGVRPRQPPGRAIVAGRAVQCTVPGGLAASMTWPSGAGEPECSTIFQPAGVLT